MKCLVVEDSPEIAERFAQIARDAGMTVAWIAPTEDGAIAACDRHSIDVAVIDLQLAAGTGFGVIRHIRKSKAKDVCCLIVITNHAVPALKVAAFEAGADYFLDKSKDFARLAKILTEMQRDHATADRGD